MKEYPLPLNIALNWATLSYWRLIGVFSRYLLSTPMGEDTLKFERFIKCLRSNDNVIINKYYLSQESFFYA